VQKEKNLIYDYCIRLLEMRSDHKFYYLEKLKDLPEEEFMILLHADMIRSLELLKLKLLINGTMSLILFREYLRSDLGKKNLFLKNQISF